LVNARNVEGVQLFILTGMHSQQFISHIARFVGTSLAGIWIGIEQLMTGARDND